jgi:hypothetical protein
MRGRLFVRTTFIRFFPQTHFIGFGDKKVQLSRVFTVPAVLGVLEQSRVVCIRFASR